MTSVRVTSMCVCVCDSVVCDQCVCVTSVRVTNVCDSVCVCVCVTVWFVTSVVCDQCACDQCVCVCASVVCDQCVCVTVWFVTSVCVCVCVTVWFVTSVCMYVCDNVVTSMSSLYCSRGASMMFLNVKVSDSKSKGDPVRVEIRSQCLAFSA